MYPTRAGDSGKKKNLMGMMLIVAIPYLNYGFSFLTFSLSSRELRKIVGRIRECLGNKPCRLEMI